MNVQMAKIIVILRQHVPIRMKLLHVPVTADIQARVRNISPVALPKFQKRFTYFSKNISKKK